MWFWYGALLIILIFGIVVFRGAPYVPSHRKFVRIAFKDLYKLTDKDVLVDIGSGDGVVLRIAAGLGARAVGYELNPILVAISRVLARGNPKIKTVLADFWFVELPPDTTVVYVFAVSRDIEKIANKIQDAATKQARPLWLITYGASVSSRQPVKAQYAHKLYLFEPLQTTEP